MFPAQANQSPVIDDPAALSVAEAGRAIDAGRLTPSALLEAVFDRIDAVDGIVCSYLRLDRAAARRAAAAATERASRGARLSPIDGVPFAVKDNIYTLGLTTTAASRVPQRHDPTLHATLVAKLQGAGAVLVGKLNTWEYGTGTGAVYTDLPVPPARNPWNPDHYTGGSSSGAGAAVAAGTALFAIGTDTGGSVRLPAAGCGVVGLKPTFGRISRHGIMPNCWSFDTPGPLTLTVEDAALVYEAVAGDDPLDPSCLTSPVDPVSPELTRGGAGLRIGHVRNLDPGGAPPDPAIVAALDRAADAFRAAGAVVQDITLPIEPSQYRAITVPINRSESFSIHERDYLEFRDLMGRALREKLEAGMYIRAVDYLAALRERRRLVAETDALFRTVDVLLLPMTYRPAPRLDDAAGVRDFTTGSAGSQFSLTGHPALALPAGFTSDGLPLSVQLAAGFRNEATLLRAATVLEKSQPSVPTRVDPVRLIGHAQNKGVTK